MAVFASKIDSPRDPRQPWEMTGQEYLADNYTGSISSGAYDSYADSQYRDWETDRKSTRLNSSH